MKMMNPLEKMEVSMLAKGTWRAKFQGPDWFQSSFDS